MLHGSLIYADETLGDLTDVVPLDFICPDQVLLALDCIDKLLVALQVYGAFL